MMSQHPWRPPVVLLLLACVAACADRRDIRPVVTFAGSGVGAEAAVVRRQLARFAASHPGVDVELRVTPDAADHRHQLFVQWLNARVPAPDVLQLDVVWTAEFAGAGWIAPLDRHGLDVEDFVPAALSAARWRGTLYAVPWFIDLGLLYWRTDLIAAPPRSLDDLRTAALRVRALGATPFGLVWQGARYEGLVTVFLEHLASFGGAILDAQGRVTVDAPAAVRALTFMRAAIADDGYVPTSVLTWQEEQTRLTFQNGNAAFMRNWPYAIGSLQDRQRSRVAGRFAVMPFPGADGGSPSAALGGAQLAVNAHSAHPQLAWELIAFLTAPAQMRERAQLAAQLPARQSLYEQADVAAVLPVPPAVLGELLRAAVARPVTPVYTELSEILQVHLHRALSGQQAPTAALTDAARDMRTLLARSGLADEVPR